MTLRGIVVGVCLWLIAAPALADLSTSEVRELENLLARLGFHPGPVDGVMDDQTTTAIEDYQDFATLPVTGRASRGLLDELRGVTESLDEIRIREAPPQAEAEPDTVKTQEATPRPLLAAPAPPGPKPAAPKKAPVETAPIETAPVATAPVETVPVETAAVPEESSAPMRSETPPPAAVPEPRAPSLQSADAAFVSKDCQRAIKLYTQLIVQGGLTSRSQAEAHNNRGRCYLEASYLEEAIADFDSAIDMQPNYAAAFFNRGRAYQALGEAALGQADMQRAYDLGFKRLGLSLTTP
jgi:tetratricopeptide (TPR) repeat protein